MSVVMSKIFNKQIFYSNSVDTEVRIRCGWLDCSALTSSQMAAAYWTHLFPRWCHWHRSCVCIRESATTTRPHGNRRSGHLPIRTSISASTHCWWRASRRRRASCERFNWVFIWSKGRRRTRWKPCSTSSTSSLPQRTSASHDWYLSS